MGATVGHETLINLNLSKLRMVKFNMNKKNMSKILERKTKTKALNIMSFINPIKEDTTSSK